jgi:inorganic pyrophosphatase
VIERRIPPAGDPFSSVSVPDRDPRPHGCYEGLVYIGRLEMTEEGEEVEVITSVPCRRCNA